MAAWQAEDGAADGGRRISAGLAFTLPVGGGETWRAGPAVVYRRERGAEAGAPAPASASSAAASASRPSTPSPRRRCATLALEHLPDYLRDGLADEPGGGVAATIGWRLRRSQ